MNGDIDLNRREVFREQCLIGIGLEIFAELAFDLCGMGEEIFDRIPLSDEFLRGFFANPWNAGNVVGGIAPQAEDVDDLSGS